MQITLNGKSVTIIREESDPKLYSDSILFHRIRNKLNEMGYDVIKKLMNKDGHLVADTQYYIRDRKGDFCIHDDQYAIRSAYRDYNDGKLILTKYE